MADERVLEADALKFAEVLHKFAGSKGWASSDYHIFMTVRPDLYTLSMVLVAKAYEGRSEEQEYKDYDEVMDFLESRIRPGGHHFNYYGLVLTGKDGYSFYASPRLGPSEIEIDEKLINNGVSWSEPFRPSRARKRAN